MGRLAYRADGRMGLRGTPAPRRDADGPGTAALPEGVQPHLGGKWVGGCPRRKEEASSDTSREDGAADVLHR